MNQKELLFATSSAALFQMANGSFMVTSPGKNRGRIYRDFSTALLSYGRRIKAARRKAVGKNNVSRS
jgi:hypothetical protein